MSTRQAIQLSQEAQSRLRVTAALWTIADDAQRRAFLDGWKELRWDPGPPRMDVLELARDGWIPASHPEGMNTYDWRDLRIDVANAWKQWANRATNIQRCGVDMHVYRCGGCRKEFAFEKTCRSRYCADCVGDVRKKTVDRINELVTKRFRHHPRFLTLTVRNKRELQGATRSLVKAFAKLRGYTKLYRDTAGNWRSWKDLVRGGIYAIEITEDLGRRDDLVWHPHLHTLFDARGYLPRQWIIEAWQRANGCKCYRSRNRQRPVLCRHSSWEDRKGEFQTWAEHVEDAATKRTPSTTYWHKNRCTGCDVEPTGVDIQRARDGKSAVRELVKYVGKSLKTSSGMMAFQPALIEFLQESWGRRMLSAYGELLGAQKKEKPEPRCCEECGRALEFVTTTPVTEWTRAPPGAEKPGGKEP